MNGLFFILIAHLCAQEAPTPGPLFSWNNNQNVRSGYRNAPWVRDPFFRSSSLKVMGIISGKLAYIDGKWVAVGDKVGKYTVREITASGVKLTDSLTVRELRLGDDQ